VGITIEGTNAHVFCDDCGKDLTVANVYGMFCEDLCGYEESVKASEQIDEMVKGILSRPG
jgi:hypothetical protein